MNKRRYTRPSVFGARAGTQRRRVETWLAAGVLAGLLAALWVWLYSGHEPTPAAAAETSEPSDISAAPVTSKQARSLVRQRLLAELARAAQEERARKAEPVRGPHPISDDHQRLYRDADLLHAAEEAIEQLRFDEAREHLLTHQRELPGMSPLEAEGLWLLVDCVEHPSASNTERVQTFYDEHTASTVRRRLRRSCLERVN